MPGKSLTCPAIPTSCLETAFQRFERVWPKNGVIFTWMRVSIITGRFVICWMDSGPECVAAASPGPDIRCSSFCTSCILTVARQGGRVWLRNRPGRDSGSDVSCRRFVCVCGGGGGGGGLNCRTDARHVSSEQQTSSRAQDWEGQWSRMDAMEEPDCHPGYCTTVNNGQAAHELHMLRFSPGLHHPLHPNDCIAFTSPVLALSALTLLPCLPLPPPLPLSHFHIATSAH